ncbi:MAG: hypothetical protein VXW32_12070 [Myxococcota bacterium]|nr:hypothetical protein [Myxococcota bacterium]
MRKSRNTPSEMPLERLIVFGALSPLSLLEDPRVRLLMATSPGWLFRLPANTLSAVIACPKCPLNLLEQLPKNRSLPLSARMAAAGRPDMPPEFLRLFMKHAALVRKELARNPSLPKDLEQILARDRFSAVRAGIAATTTDPDLINELAHDRSLQRVRVAVASNPALTVRARNYLSQSSLLEIQEALLRNNSRSTA